jgi:hypothetical protein
LALAGGVARDQSHHNQVGVSGPASATFPQNLDIGKFAGIFERSQEFQFAFVVPRSYRQLQFKVILSQPGFDADDSNSIGQAAFQIHEDLSPGKSPLRDQTVQEARKFPPLNCFGAVEEYLQIGAMLAKRLHVAFDSRLLQSNRGIGAPHAVNVPREESHGDQAHAADGDGKNRESPIAGEG